MKVQVQKTAVERKYGLWSPILYLAQWNLNKDIKIEDMNEVITAVLVTSFEKSDSKRKQKLDGMTLRRQ